MRHMRSGISFVALSIVAALFVGVMLGAPPGARAQATISTGSVQGVIVDPKGAVVVSARVTITNKDTGQKLESEVTSAGTYNSGPLAPGRYVVRLAAQGFKTVEQTVEVAVGIITSANITLELGSENTVVTVESSAISVNTEQDRKSTRLNSSHSQISYAVFCLKKKKKTNRIQVQYRHESIRTTYRPGIATVA